MNRKNIPFSLFCLFFVPFPVFLPFSLNAFSPSTTITTITTNQIKIIKIKNSQILLEAIQNKVVFYYELLSAPDLLILLACLWSCRLPLADEDNRIQMRLYSYFLITKFIISSHFLSIPPLRIQPMSCFRLFLWVSFDLGRLG